MPIATNKAIRLSKLIKGESHCPKIFIGPQKHHRKSYKENGEMVGDKESVSVSVPVLCLDVCVSLRVCNLKGGLAFYRF